MAVSTNSRSEAGGVHVVAGQLRTTTQRAFLGWWGWVARRLFPELKVSRGLAPPGLPAVGDWAILRGHGLDERCGKVLWISKDWYSVVFGDPVVATAILDRLLHHSHVLTIRGDSYRLRAKRKSGLIKLPAADGPRVGSASLRPVSGGATEIIIPMVGAVLHDAKGAVPDGV
ncbi:hypothetical protein ACVIGB_008495 [Bradyrhizobium sp. USDA 4341]